MTQKIIIETNNFYLRPFDEKEDYQLCYDLWHDEEVIRPMGITYLEYPKEYITTKLTRYTSFMDEFGFTNFAVFKKENDEFIGSCGFGILHNPDGNRNPLQNNPNNQDVELGYLFYKKHWGKGYATELAKNCCNFIWNNYPNIKRIIAITYPTNIASEKVLTKIGFEFVSNIESKEYGKEKFFVLYR